MVEKPSYEELEKRIQELEQAESPSSGNTEKVFHSHDLMDYIISHARSAIAVFDRDFKYIYVSKRYLADYKVEERDVIGKFHYDVFPDIPEKWRKVHQSALQGNVMSAEEDPYYRDDGSIDWTQWECRPWYDADGSIGGIIIYNEVINERKKIEAALQKSEQLLSTHLLNTPIGAISWDTAFKMVEWNPAAEKIFGFTKEEAIGKHIDELIIPEDLKALVNGIFSDLASEKGGTRSINENITKDGRRIICDWYNTILKDDQGNIIGAAALVNDITQAKRIEEALQESEEKYRLMMETTPDQTYICSHEFHIEYMNPAMNHKVGRDATGEICYQAIYNRDKRCPWCVFDRVQQKEHVKHEVTDPVRDSYYSVINSPICHTDGTISKLTIRRDITEIKIMEESLRQAQKMDSLGTLTGGIAHDFNNILGIIAGNTELALEDVPQWNPAYSNLKEIKTASLRAADIVRRLLSFSRKTDQKLLPIQIAPVIEEAIKFLRPTIPSFIHIHQNIQLIDEIVLADPTQISQILMNLFINASHAMEQSGGDLTITVESIILDEVSAKKYPELQKGRYVKIAISDTGLGIDPKIIDRIFDPYFTTKGVGKGSGMGLAVVHGIVQNHNGAIDVESRLGSGTIFSILLPLAHGQIEVETDNFQGIPMGKETILFVDDEISIVKMAARMFERLGYAVKTAVTPQEALEMFRLHPDHFDLVITDMTMPRMTGVKLSEMLMEIRPDIPIIICTGHSALVDEEKAKKMGLASYVMKPINMTEIARTIRKVLDKKQWKSNFSQ